MHQGMLTLLQNTYPKITFIDTAFGGMFAGLSCTIHAFNCVQSRGLQRSVLSIECVRPMVRILPGFVQLLADKQESPKPRLGVTCYAYSNFAQEIYPCA